MVRNKLRMQVNDMFVYWINMLYVVKFNSNSIIIRETFMLNYKNVYDFNGLLKRLKYNLNLRICLIPWFAQKTGHKKDMKIQIQLPFK